MAIVLAASQWHRVQPVLFCKEEQPEGDAKTMTQASSCPSKPDKCHSPYLSLMSCPLCYLIQWLDLVSLGHNALGCSCYALAPEAPHTATASAQNNAWNGQCCPKTRSGTARLVMFGDGAMHQYDTHSSVTTAGMRSAVPEACCSLEIGTWRGRRGGGTLKTSPLSAHSRSPKRPSWGRMKMEWPSLRLTSVYRADAIVASGVLPWHLIKPRCRATLAMSPAARAQTWYKRHAALEAEVFETRWLGPPTTAKHVLAGSAQGFSILAGCSSRAWEVASKKKCRSCHVLVSKTRREDRRAQMPQSHVYKTRKKSPLMTRCRHRLACMQKPTLVV